MKITVDTNVLLRVVLDDDVDQQDAAQRTLAAAELVAIPTAVLCEMVWVLSRSYKLSRSSIADLMRALLTTASVRVETQTVEAGLAALDAGGDFANGAIAIDGARLGGHEFVTFDRKAASIRRAQGGKARVLTTR